MTKSLQKEEFCKENDKKIFIRDVGLWTLIWYYETNSQVIVHSDFLMLDHVFYEVPEKWQPSGWYLIFSFGLVLLFFSWISLLRFFIFFPSTFGLVSFRLSAPRWQTKSNILCSSINVTVFNICVWGESQSFNLVSYFRDVCNKWIGRLASLVNVGKNTFLV